VATAQGILFVVWGVLMLVVMKPMTSRAAAKGEPLRVGPRAYVTGAVFFILAGVALLILAA
jgi:hypothetical protein